MLTNFFSPCRINPWSVKGILCPKNEALQYVTHYTPGSRGKLRDGLDDPGGDGQACCTANSCPMKRRRRSRYWLYSSMSLCPAPSTQRGSTALGQRSNRARPWEKSITSSSVPWMMSTGDVILDTFSMLKRGKGKKSDLKGIDDLLTYPF